MASQIKVVKKQQKMAAQEKNLYTIHAVRYSTISGEELVDAASRNSNVNKGVLRSATNAVLNEFHNFLMNGHSVELPGIGYFRFSFSAKAPETLAELKEKGVKITQKRVLYRPNVTLATKLNEINILETGAYDINGNEVKPRV